VAAYAGLGVDYVEEECQYAEGAKTIFYKGSEPVGGPLSRAKSLLPRVPAGKGEASLHRRRAGGGVRELFQVWPATMAGDSARSEVMGAGPRESRRADAR
jgi:hypothetical protein